MRAPIKQVSSATANHRLTTAIAGVILSRRSREAEETAKDLLRTEAFRSVVPESFAVYAAQDET
jgi:hypothetical protein